MSMDATPTDAPLLSAHIIEEINGLMGRRRINRAEMARRLGKSEVWIGRRLNGQIPIAVDEMQAIAVVLGVDAVDLLPKGVTGRYPTRPIGQRTIATIGQDRRARSVVRTGTQPNRRHRIGRAVSQTRPLVPLDRRTTVASGR